MPTFNQNEIWAGKLRAYKTALANCTGPKLDPTERRHPISGEKIILNSSTNSTTTTDDEDLFAAADSDAFRTLIRNWRNGDNEKFWSIADVRMPAYDRADAASIQSAFAGAGNRPGLLLFTIASPQQFIVNSRRTQDSWMGSFIFSYLSWKAIESVIDGLGPDSVLFPSLRGQPMVDKWLRSRGIDTPEPTSAELMIAGFPNQFTAIVPFEDSKTIAERAECAVKTAWNEIANEVFESLDKAGFSNTKSVRESQLSCFLEDSIFWSAYPFEDNDSLREDYRIAATDPANTYFNLIEAIDPAQRHHYQAVATIAARALSSRKNIRDFSNNKAEIGERCTLCDSRTALSDSPGSARSFWRGIIRTQKRASSRIKGGEMLCAVCVIKRFANDYFFQKKFGFPKAAFPSTATISTAPFKLHVLRQVSQDKVFFELVKKYVVNAEKLLKKIGLFVASSPVPKVENAIPTSRRFSGVCKRFVGLDGQWLFDESFESKEVLDAVAVSSDPDSIEQMRQTAIESLRALRKYVPIKPSRYYAVVAMDGDHIGRWLNGTAGPKLRNLLHSSFAKNSNVWRVLANARNKTRPITALSHLTLSTVLRNFANRIAGLVTEELHCGRLIYAGGDDVLAFVPAGEVFRVVGLLKILFQGESLEIEGILKSGNGLISFGEGSTHLAAGTGDDALTASIGVAIVHSSQPMSFGIREATDEALKNYAKETLGRNAIAFHLKKRAGGPVRVGIKWSSETGSNRIGLMGEIFNLVSRGDLSPRIASKMDGLADALEAISDAERDGVEMQFLARLAKRQSRPESAEHVARVLRSYLSVSQNPARPGEGWRQVIDTIKFTRFMAEEGHNND